MKDDPQAVGDELKVQVYNGIIHINTVRNEN